MQLHCYMMIRISHKLTWALTKASIKSLKNDAILTYYKMIKKNRKFIKRTGNLKYNVNYFEDQFESKKISEKTNRFHKKSQKIRSKNDANSS